MADDDIPNDVKEEVADVSFYFLFFTPFYEYINAHLSGCL